MSVVVCRDDENQLPILGMAEFVSVGVKMTDQVNPYSKGLNTPMKNRQGMALLFLSCLRCSGAAFMLPSSSLLTTLVFPQLLAPISCG